MPPDDRVPFNIPSVPVASSFIIDSISTDTGIPKHCAVCLLGALSIVYDAAEEIGKPSASADIAVAFSKDPALCTAIATFLIRPRSSKDVSGLMSSLSRCSCPPGEPYFPWFHTIGPFFGRRWHSQYSFEAIFILLLFDRLGMILRSVSRASFAKGGTETSKKKTKKWPTCSSDMLPFDGETTVKSLGQWSILLPEPGSIYFLTGCLPLAGRDLFQSITSSSVFLKQLMVAFQTACSRARALTGVVVVKARVTDLTPMESLMEFLFRMMNETQSKADCIVEWVQGHEEKLLKLFSDTIYVLYDPVSKPVRDESRLTPRKGTSIFNDISRLFPKSIPRPSGLHPELRSDLSHMFPDEPTITHTNLFWWFLDIRKGRQCFGPGCRLRAVDVGPAFRRCGKCEIMTYCSKACQKADWELEGRFPHAAMCPSIKEFFIASGGIPEMHFTTKVHKFSTDPVDVVRLSQTLPTLLPWYFYTYAREDPAVRRVAEKVLLAMGSSL